MAVYKPLFMYLTPASIPQVVAHIQKYLADNPIISDPEAIAEAIQKYIEEHPEIIAVASVNGKTGNVVLTGSDININASSEVSVETQLLNLASMINNVGADITQIEANISQIYTDIGTLQTNVETNASNISALQTSVEGQGTRLTAAETDIDALQSAQSAQNTRLNTAEGNINSLQSRMTNAESGINSNSSQIETMNTSISNIQDNLNSFIQTGVWNPVFSRATVDSITSATFVRIGKLVFCNCIVLFGTSSVTQNVYIEFGSLPFSDLAHIGISGSGRLSGSNLNITLSSGQSNNNIWLTRGAETITGTLTSGQTGVFTFVYSID